MGVSTNDPRNYIAIGRQSARDVEATEFHFARHLEGSMVDPDPEVQREREGGDGQRVGLSYRSQVKADPVINENFRPHGGAVALAGVLGADVAQASIGGGLHRHTLVPTTFLRYYTVDERAADEVSRVTNNKFTQVEATFEAGRPIRLDSQLISGGTYYGRPLASALTPTRETGKPVFYPGASVVVTGAPNAEVTKGKLTITRDIDGDIQTTGLTRADVVEQNQDSQLDLTIKFEDAVLWRRAHLSGGSQAGLDLATIGLDLFARQAGGSGSLRLAAPIMEVTAAKLNKLDPDGKTCYYDVAAADIASPTHMVFAEVVTSATAPYA